MSSTSLGYRDFWLVIKAFQLKENGFKEMLCSCGLEKEDIALSEGEEIFLKQYENHIKSNGRIQDRFEFIFKIVFIMVPLSDDDISAAEKLENIFSDMSSFKVLFWCARFLMKFHEKNQCSQYLSSALKFYLKSFEITESAYFYSSFPVDKKMVELLKLSSKYYVHHSVFLEFLRLICRENFYLYYCNFDYISILETIFKAGNEIKIDLLKEWKEVDPVSYDVFIQFTSSFVKNFIPFITYGKTECLSFSKESQDYWESALDDFYSEITIGDNFGTSSTSFRSLQIMYSFLCAERKIAPPTTAAHFLKLLWNSITDPFLRRNDLLKSGLIVLPTGAHDVDILHKAWTWYDDHVLENKNSPKGPRSLCHLSRCFIRRHLTSCFQLPRGVEQLDIPMTLKNYILLEDCKPLPNAK